MFFEKAYEIARKVAQEQNLIVAEYLILPSGIVFTLVESKEDNSEGATQIKVKPTGKWEWFDINLNLQEFADSGNEFVDLLNSEVQENV